MSRIFWELGYAILSSQCQTREDRRSGLCAAHNLMVAGTISIEFYKE